MFSLAALVPSPPVLVPELCGRVEAEPVAQLRAAVLAAVAELGADAAQWTVVGVADRAARFGPGTVGTFRGFGADVAVRLAPEPAQRSAVPSAPPRADVPLPVLVAGWLRGRAAPAATAEARLLAPDTPVADCLAFGADLRTESDRDAVPRGVLVVADGAATLSSAAPGYLDDAAAPVQQELDRALQTGSRTATAALDPGLCARIRLDGRAAYQALAGLFAVDDADPEVRTRYLDAPYGVGYHVGLWRPAARTSAERT